MPASFPASIKSFITKVDNVTDVLAAHINDLQDEVAAIETALGAGLATSIVQIVHFNSGTYATGSCTSNLDNTPPLISEGVEVMTLAITPKSVSNKILALVSHHGVGGNGYLGSFLFCPTISATDALAGNYTLSGGAWRANTSYIHAVTSGLILTAMTFSVRQFEATGSQTFYFNGANSPSGQLFTTAVKTSSITLIEYK